MATAAETPARATRSRAKAKPAPEVEAAPKAKKGETVQQLKNRLRNEAEREVLNNHKDEVISITQAKYDEHGLEYVRRLSDKEKAAKEIAEKINQFPELRALFAPVGASYTASVEQQQQQFEQGYAYAYLQREEVPAEPGGALEQFRQANDAYDPEPEPEELGPDE